mmetsp:Transcript_41346/g.109538  ORF Transcript_41346/g.109538 Transcript_41346/m.109538 type:complete len:233 (-) Transcript_41346:400-1098(-)
MAVGLHVLRQLERGVSGVDEDHTLADVQGAVQLRQLLLLHGGIIPNVNESLVNCLQSEIGFGHRNSLWLPHHRLGELLNSFWERGRKQKYLYLVRKHLLDLCHLRTHLIALIDDDVRLVKDEDSHPPGIDDVFLEQLLYFAWGADYHLRRCCRGVLGTLRHGKEILHRRELAQGFDNIVVLCCEFTRGADAKALGPLIRFVHTKEHRKCKSRRLARPVSSLANDVAPFQRDR